MTIFGSGSECLGFENQARGMRDIAKTDPHRNWNPHDFRFHFSGFWVALGPVLMTFAALEAGRKIADFAK